MVEKFFFQIVQPIIYNKYPKLRYGAALLGSGSEVLGFDDEISRDHDWGLRLFLFLDPAEMHSVRHSLDVILRKQLPPVFMGHSTNWGDPDPEDNNTMMPQEIDTESVGIEINHRITITTVKDYLKKLFSFNGDQVQELRNLSINVWIRLSEQQLLEFTAGRVYFDNLGELTDARKLLEYYPETIWKIVILGEWNAITEEHVFMARCGSRGDSIGSTIISTFLVSRIMRLAFHLERKYVPYSKWFGIAFKELPISEILSPPLEKILDTSSWKEREELLIEALSLVMRKHAEIGLIEPYDYGPVRFHSREFFIMDWSRLIDQLKENLPGNLKRMFQPIGTINQFIAYKNILAYNQFHRSAEKFFEELLSE